MHRNVIVSLLALACVGVAAPARAESWAPGDPGVDTLIAEADSDGDEQVTREEMRVIFFKSFDADDEDGDGVACADANASSHDCAAPVYRKDTEESSDNWFFVYDRNHDGVITTDDNPEDDG